MPIASYLGIATASISTIMWGTAAGLIEAGVLMTDSTELKQIECWFDRHYDDATVSRSISELDLEAARRARPLGPRKFAKRSLFEAMREGGTEEFKRIYFVICKEYTTKAEDSSAERYLNKVAVNMVGAKNINRVSWYRVSRGLKEDVFIIDCYYRNGSITTRGVCKTFPVKANVYIPVNGTNKLFSFVVSPKYAHFTYKLTKEDKAVINRAASELWVEGVTNNTGKILSLLNAKTILLRHTEQSV